MNALLRIILLSIIFIFSQNAQAQILDKVKDAAQRGVEQTLKNRTEKEAENATNAVVDEILGEKKNNSKKKSKPNQSDSNSQSQNDSMLEETDSNNTPSLEEDGNNQVEFKRGNTILFSDDFSEDAIGDFPAQWNTSLGGEVKRLKGHKENYLRIPANSMISLDKKKSFPENFTVEMDVIIPNNLPYNMACIGFGERPNGFGYTLAPFNGFAIMLYAKNQKSDFRYGNSDLNVEFIQKPYSIPFNKKIHLAFQVNQYSRIRVYIDGKKMVDLPKIFKPEYANELMLHAITHGDSESNKNYFYVSNIVISATGLDERSLVMKNLSEKGSFSTNEIQFATASDEINSSSVAILKEIGKAIESMSNAEFLIIGHTDSDGDTQSNQQLSEQRAKAVKNYLTQNFSISTQQLITVGKGESQPIADNSTSQGKAQNRRVEFKKL